MCTSSTDSDMPHLTETSSEDEALVTEAQPKAKAKNQTPMAKAKAKSWSSQSVSDARLDTRTSAVGDRAANAHRSTRAADFTRARGQAPFSWAFGFSGEDSVFDLVPPEDLAMYECLATRRPVARAHLAEREDRETCIFLAAAFFLNVRRSQIEHGCITLTPPCDRCALPTGSWCDGCRQPLCKSCDQRYGCCGGVRWIAHAASSFVGAAQARRPEKRGQGALCGQKGLQEDVDGGSAGSFARILRGTRRRPRVGEETESQKKLHCQ